MPENRSGYGVLYCLSQIDYLDGNPKTLANHIGRYYFLCFFKFIGYFSFDEIILNLIGPNKIYLLKFEKFQNTKSTNTARGGFHGMFFRIPWNRLHSTFHEIVMEWNGKYVRRY